MNEVNMHFISLPILRCWINVPKLSLSYPLYEIT